MVDGATPRAKQATLGHIAKREINRAKAMGKQHQLRVVTKSLMEDSLTANQRAALVVKCGALGRQVTTAETQAVSVVPKDFADLLEQALEHLSAHETNTAGGRVLRVHHAQFQADSLLNGLHATSTCDFIMSNDVDYPVQNGDDCIAIKVFNGPSLTVSSTSRSTLDDAMRGLGEDGEQIRKVKEPASPLFEGLHDRRLRVLLAVIIGSDAWPSGVPGLGQGKVADYLNSLVADYLDGAEDAVKDDKEMYAKVIKWAAEKAKHLKGTPTNRRFNEDVLGGCMGGWMGGWLYGWICQGWLGMVG